MIAKIFRTILSLLKSDGIDIAQSLSDMDYWENRAKQFGKRAVFNIAHTEEELEKVTLMQKREIFPQLKKVLKGNEKMILDFGCGSGRFTKDLAELIDGESIGVDPIKSLIDLAPAGDNVEYKIMNEGRIPLEDHSIDIVWICLVLGGITKDKILRETILEIKRALRPGGVVFLVENTSDKISSDRWIFRSVKEYQELFPFVKIKHLSDYFDCGEKISIMAGLNVLFDQVS